MPFYSAALRCLSLKPVHAQTKAHFRLCLLPILLFVLYFRALPTRFFFATHISLPTACHLRSKAQRADVKKAEGNETNLINRAEIIRFLSDSWSCRSRLELAAYEELQIALQLFCHRRRSLVFFFGWRDGKCCDFRFQNASFHAPIMRLVIVARHVFNR